MDEKYEDLFFKEELIKNIEKLPQNIELSLEKVKNVNKFWNDKNKLSSLINACINLEKTMDNINEKIIKEKTNINVKIKLSLEEIQKISIMEQIKSFGNIFGDSYNYIFKKCPDNTKEDRTLIITGDNENIMAKTTLFRNLNLGGTTCLCKLEIGKKYK